MSSTGSPGGGEYCCGRGKMNCWFREVGGPSQGRVWKDEGAGVTSVLFLTMPGGRHKPGSSGPEHSQRFSFLTRLKASTSRAGRELLRDDLEKKHPRFSLEESRTLSCWYKRIQPSSPLFLADKSHHRSFLKREQNPGQTRPRPCSFVRYLLTPSSHDVLGVVGTTG